MEVRLKLADLFERPILFRERDEPRNWPDVAILCGWMAAVLWRITHHVMWRDEVRALSIALNGDNTIDMLRGLHGEGHPAVWYLLLRGAYAVFGRVEVLAGVSFAVALATVALVIFRSPFPRVFVLLLVTGHYSLYAFSVSARNYGICALVMFTIAACYRSRRDRGIVLGLLLFLLANTNVVAVIMGGGFLLFWLIEILQETGLRWSRQLTHFCLNALIFMIGVVVCAVTILPTFNDAAARDWSTSSPVPSAIKAILNPGGTALGTLVPDFVPQLAGPVLRPALRPLATILLFGCTLGLLPRRSAFIAACATLLIAALFYAVGANGSYRHATIWLCFCLALYWICWRDVVAGAVARPRKLFPGALTFAGRSALALLLYLQSVDGVGNVVHAVRSPDQVDSRSADLGELIASRADLASAIIVAEPDFLVEALPYYLDRRTYLIRGRRFGSIVRFTKSEQLDTDLSDVLRTSRELQQTEGGPIVILLHNKLDSLEPGKVYKSGYNWTFRASAEQIREFQDATTLIHRFGPAASEEDFDVYLLK